MADCGIVLCRTFSSIIDLRFDSEKDSACDVEESSAKIEVFTDRGRILAAIE